MKTRHRTAVIVVGITILLASQALAAPPGWGGGRGRGRGGGWGQGSGPRASTYFGGNRSWGGPMWQRPAGPGPDRMQAARPRGGRRNWQGRRGRQWQNCPWMQQRGRRGPASFGNRPGRGNWGPARARRPQGPPPMLQGQFFDRADKDNDGKLSREEINAFRGQAGRFRPGSRAVGPQDAPGGRGAVPPAGREGRGRQRPQGRQGGAAEPSADRPRAGGRGPGAGQPSQQRGPLMLKRIFEQADTNEDGLLSMAEVEAFQDKMKDRPGFPGR